MKKLMIMLAILLGGVVSAQAFQFRTGPKLINEVVVDTIGFFGPGTPSYISVDNFHVGKAEQLLETIPFNVQAADGSGVNGSYTSNRITYDKYQGTTSNVICSSDGYIIENTRMNEIGDVLYTWANTSGSTIIELTTIHDELSARGPLNHLVGQLITYSSSTGNTCLD